MSVLVGATLAAYKLDRPEWCTPWLLHAEEMREQATEEVHFFATFETDARPFERFAPVADRLRELEGADAWWTFQIPIPDLGRIPRICFGRNLLIDRMLADHSVSHVLFVDVDVEVPPDSIDRLLSLDHPVVGGCVPSYSLDGPAVSGLPGRDVREHWNTAGFLLVQRAVLCDVRWGWDFDNGVTDDPWFQVRVERHGWGGTWVDHDLLAPHHPPVLYPIEQRHDMTRHDG